MTCALISKQWLHVISSQEKRIKLKLLTNNDVEMKGQFLENVERMVVKDSFYRSRPFDCRVLYSMKLLTHLEVRSNTIDVELVSQLKQLKYLDIYNSNIDNEGIKHIAGMNNLTFLNVGFNEIDDQGAEIISSMSQLESLHIADSNFSKKGIEFISNMILKDLDVSQTDIYSHGVEILSKMKI